MKHFDMMIFLTYTLGEEALANGYERWVRDEDNPFFNAIPGMGRYENWKLVGERPADLQFGFYDFMNLASDADLERVWFSSALDDFRKGWIRKWGYGGGSRIPSPANASGWLARRESPPPPRRSPFLALICDAPQPIPGAERWRITEAVRKHYAIGPAPAGEPWRRPLRSGEGHGITTLDVIYADDCASAERLASVHGTARYALIAECFASPLLQ
jgi:hypothetical protein